MIVAKNIYKTYKNGSVKVINGISVEIEDGSFTVISGASGSGKSTLMSILSGLERPDSGKILYGKEDITILNNKDLTKFRRENTGFIFQQYYLLSHLSVDKNVKMGADLVKNSEYREIINAVGLEDKLKSRPFELSGGEQQRVCIARALAKKPKVLFLDEPTGALDEATGRSVLDYLVKLQKCDGFTMIMVTHNLNIADMADVVINIGSGKIAGIKKNKNPKSAYEIGW